MLPSSSGRMPSGHAVVSSPRARSRPARGEDRRGDEGGSEGRGSRPHGGSCADQNAGAWGKVNSLFAPDLSYRAPTMLTRFIGATAVSIAAVAIVACGRSGVRQHVTP